jgi:protein TonB
MRLGHRHPRLRAFVLGSLAVHGLLLAVWAASVRFGAEPRAALSVRLDGDPDAAPSARVERAQKPRTERTHATASPAPIEAQASDEHDAARAAPAAVAAAETGNDDEIRARIEARLRLDLARHFDYPWIARLRGWEGDMLLGVIVQAGGRLDAVRVLRSSGFAVLDRSAVDSLRRVGRIPEAVAWLHGRDLEMRLPVSYRLEGER